MDNLNASIEAMNVRQPVVRSVLKYPDAMLQKASEPVIIGSTFSLTLLKYTLDDMVATMQAHRAVGLAGIQIGVPLRLLVVQDANMQPVRVVNPRIVEQTGHSFELEGCLSFPGLFMRVPRPAHVVIEYFDEQLQRQETGYGSLLGRAILHEMDHLDGKTYLDRVSSIERESALRKLKHRKRKLDALVKSLTAKPAPKKKRKR